MVPDERDHVPLPSFGEKKNYKVGAEMKKLGCFLPSLCGCKLGDVQDNIIPDSN